VRAGRGWRGWLPCVVPQMRIAASMCVCVYEVSGGLDGATDGGMTCCIARFLAASLGLAVPSWDSQYMAQEASVQAGGWQLHSSSALDEKRMLRPYVRSPQTHFIEFSHHSPSLDLSQRPIDLEDSSVHKLSLVCVCSQVGPSCVLTAVLVVSVRVIIPASSCLSTWQWIIIKPRNRGTMATV